MTRMYSLYEKRGRRWFRLVEFGLSKPNAVRVFQSALISQTFRLNSDKAHEAMYTTGRLELRPTGVKV